MPWMDSTGEVLGPVGILPPLPAEPEAPGLGETLGAALRQGNFLASAIASERAPLPGAIDPEFDAMANLSDTDRQHYAPIIRDLAGALTAEEAERAQRQFDMEQDDRATLEMSGTAGTVALIGAGIVDPINLLPIGGAAYRAARLGGSIGKQAGELAKIGLLSTTAQEVGLQATQVSRPWQESAFNIAGGTILSGVLGAGIGAWAKRDGAGLKAVADAVQKDMREIAVLEGSAPPEGLGGSVGAAAVASPGIQSETLKGAAGLEKTLGFANPFLRVVQSPSVSTRMVAQELADSGGLAFQKNDMGIATAKGGAVETRVKMWDAPLADSLMEADRVFVAYRLGREKRLGDLQRIGAGDLLGSGGKLTRNQFYEAVGQAMRRGDTHQIPEVQEAAQYFRKSLFDPVKQRAIEAKLLDEGVEVGTSASYMTRIYDKVKIKARRPELTRRFVSWLKGKNPEADEGELYLAADQIVDRILGTPDGRVPYDAVGDIKISDKTSGGNLRGARGPAMGRVLDIEDSAIEDFLESNIEVLARAYTRTFGSDAEIAARFGDPMMTKAFQDVQGDYARMADKLERKGKDNGWGQGKLDKKLKALHARKDADLRDLAAMRDRIRHRYKLPTEPDGIAATAGRIARTWNYLRLMGSAALASLPEAFRTMMVHGFGRSFRAGLLPLVRGLKTVKLANKEVRLSGAALDMVLDSRAMAMADVTDDFARGTKVERGLRFAQDRFGMVSLLAPWTAITKQFAGIVTITRMLESAAAWKAGKVSQKDLSALAAGGIDEELARRIAGEFEQHGRVEKGVWLPETANWTDRDAVTAFRAALLRDVDRIITTPGVGDKPLWMSGDLGKTLFQFKSFTMSATQRVLISGMQQRDAAFFSGAIAMIGMGMFRYALYLWAAEKAMPDSWEQWVAEGVDRSGITGWLFEAHNGLEKVTGGTVGINALTGGAPMSRYASRSAVDSLLGPTFGGVKDAVDVISAASSGQWTPSAAGALRRMIPYQNLFYIRGLFDRLQQGMKP